MPFWITILIIAVLIGISIYNNKKAEREKRFNREINIIVNRKLEPEDEPSQSQPQQSQQIGLPESIDVKVKGTSYRSIDEIAAARMCDVGDTMILEPEPENEVDPNAIKVYTIEGAHIGYVESAYAPLVNLGIKHIKSCVISKYISHEVPYIYLKIEFSKNEAQQPQFIKKEYQCTAEDKIRQLRTKPIESYQYNSRSMAVQDLYERSREVIAKARACRSGDKIILRKGESSEAYPERIDVYLADGTYLGHGHVRDSKDIYRHFDEIVDTIVDAPISKETSDRLIVRVIFPAGIDLFDKSLPFISTTHGSFYDGAYQEVRMTRDIRRTDPAAALDILLPIAEKERGYEASEECIACYYQLKMWQERIDIIRKTIDRIDNLTEADLPKFDLMLARQEIPVLSKQLDFSMKRLESQQKKSKK